MTKISYIAGIGADESAQRASFVPKQPFIPYLSMTKGEMHLALMLEQAQILAGYYGTPKYKEAAQMLENQLYKGVHGGTPYLGAYDPSLVGVAKAISRASRENTPASKAGFYRDGGIGKGIHIGETIIDYDARGKICRREAEKANTKNERERRIRVCEQTWRIEKILNDGIENCGQYVAYGYLPKSNGLPQVANLKIYQQELAQNDISRVGKFDLSLTQQWLNVGMMRRNADTAKIAPYGWPETNTILMALPEEAQNEVLKLLGGAAFSRVRSGTLSRAQIGAKIAEIIRKYKGESAVGEPISATIAIIAGITALIGAINSFAKTIKNEQVDAFAQVNGFGSRPFGPEDGDWDGSGLPQQQSSNLWPLLIGGGALLAYTLTK